MSHPCEAPPLAPGEVHVWTFRLDLDRAWLEALERWLAPEERRRAATFRFARDRRRFVAARARLREVLARYLRVAPSEVTLAYGPQGKPCLARPEAPRFNLSHSEEEAVLAVAGGREVGIDLEKVRPDFQCDRVARFFFSRAETAALSALPAAERPPAFFACWTRKEAFVKALGGGLAVPLADFDVSVDPDRPARLLHTAWDTREASRWSLHSIPAPGGYASAIAVEGPAPRIRAMEGGF